MLNSRWCNQLLQSLHSKPNPSSHWASRTSNLMFPQALSRSDCCLNIRVGEGKSDLGDKGGNPGGLWWVFMEWYVYIMHINIIYHVWYTSPCMYPLLLSLFPFIFQIFPKCFSLKSPSVPSKVCWVVGSSLPMTSKYSSMKPPTFWTQSCHGKPTGNPGYPSRPFWRFFLLNHQDPLRIPLKKRLCFLGVAGVGTFHCQMKQNNFAKTHINRIFTYMFHP